MYQDYLGRPVDVGGLSTWVPALQSGALTAEQVAVGLLSSPEFLARG
jgi:hypothetical protein